MIVAIHPDSGSPVRRPPKSRTSAPSSGQRHDDVGGVHGVAQPLREWMSSAVAAARRRNMATMIARPTTTSAAATTSTKNTDDWPPMSLSMRPKVTKVRLTRVEHELDAHEHDQHVAPHQQPDAADGEQDGRQDQVPGPGNAHSAVDLLLLGLRHLAGHRQVVAGQDHRGHHRDDQQGGGHFEGQQVPGVDRLPELLDVLAGAAELAGVAVGRGAGGRVLYAIGPMLHLCTWERTRISMMATTPRRIGQRSLELGSARLRRVSCGPRRGT